MAEAFVNSICNLILISGEPGSAAPFVGVSAQIDTMQDFMEGDLLLTMEAGGIPDPPEVKEIKGEVAKGEAEVGLFDKMNDFLFPEKYYPIFGPSDGDDPRGGVTPPDLERIVQELMQSFGEMRSRGEGDAEEKPTTPDAAQPKTWDWRKIAPIFVAIGTVVSQFGGQICNGIRVIMPGLAKIGAAVARYSPGVAKVLAKIGAGKAAAFLLPLLGTFSEKFKTIATVLGTIAQMVSEFMQTYMMVSQFQSLNEYARYLSPELGMFNDEINNVEEFISGQYESSPRDIQQPDDEARGRGTTTPADPLKAPKTVKRKRVSDNKEFTINTALRIFTTEQMPMIEALLKKLILSLNSKIDPVDGPPKMHSITDILYDSLNYTPPKGSTGALSGPPHEWSLAEILSKGIPVIEHTDPITKRVTHISVFELIMHAQDAKVLELGPGFLKWYTELDVLQSNQAVIETPKTGM